MRHLSLIFFLLFSGASASAQVRAKATVDSTRMLIGDQVKLYLEAATAAGAELSEVDLEKLKKDPVEFVSQTRWEDIGGGKRFRKTLVFTVWDSGYHAVPPIPVVALQNGLADTTFTNDIPMEVSSVPAPDLADIKGIIEEPETWRDYLPVIIGVGVFLLAGLLIFLGIRMKTKSEDLPPPPPPPPLPSHELAVKKLGILRSEKLWQNGEVKQYHSRLTHIVREYLEGRYGIQALEQTTDQILGQMRKNALSPNLTEKMTALLQTADLVKFAKAEPPVDYHGRAMKMAEEFVEETKWVEVSEATSDESQITNHESQ